MASQQQDLTAQILAWWQENRYRTLGDYGHQNLFDDVPDFVAMATESASPTLIAQAAIAWWTENRHLTEGPRGERNVFDFAPDFVDEAKILVGYKEQDPYS